MDQNLTWKHYLALAAVILAAACPVCCWGPARADEPARVDAATVCAVQDAIRWREAAWTPGQCERVASALLDTPEPLRMFSIAINESDLRAKALRVSVTGTYDIGLMGIRCVTRTFAEDTQDLCLNGPARGLTVAKLLDPVTNIRTAWAAYEMHSRDPGAYNGATGKRAKRYRQRIEAIEAALMGLPFVAPDKRTRELCRRIAGALGKERRT